MNLLDYAILANEAYATKPTIGDEKTSARAVVSIVADGTAIGFPGTNNGRCLETDIDALIHDSGALGRVHRGTAVALESIWDDLSKLTPDIIYGHSLGGMLALLCAACLCVSCKPPKAVYAFEPAKITVDGKIKAIFVQYGVKVVITRNGNDAIPIMPELLFENWQHPGDVLHFPKAILPFPNVEDHMMDKVIEAVKEYLESMKG